MGQRIKFDGVVIGPCLAALLDDGRFVLLRRTQVGLQHLQELSANICLVLIAVRYDNVKSCERKDECSY
jgi:hypothetical protein